MTETIRIHSAREPGKSEFNMNYLAQLLAVGDHFPRITVAISEEIAGRVRLESDIDLDQAIAAGRVKVYPEGIHGHQVLILEEVDEFKGWGPGPDFVISHWPSALPHEASLRFPPGGDLVMNHEPVFIEAKTYQPVQIVQFDAERYVATIKEHVELPPSPRHPAHNAPNRRRFKRNSRKR